VCSILAGHHNAPLLHQFDSAVKRVRLMGMKELEQAAGSLGSLGLPHATYFQGISSRGYIYIYKYIYI